MTRPLLPITVLVQTKNEEIGIQTCLAGLSQFDQVIVVDSHSDDRTKELSRAAGAEVIDFVWNGQYPKKKQWQLENLQTRHDWVLFIDADETPTPELLQELRLLSFSDQGSPSTHKATLEAGALFKEETAAADIPLSYFFEGKELKHGHRVVKRALVHKNRVEFPVMNDLDAPGMGELEGHYQPEAQGKILKLSGRIKHDDQDPISTWFARHNKYSDWEAYLRTQPETREEISRRRSFQGRLFDKVPFKPFVFFTYSYVLRRGFLDGKEGFDYAAALSHYYWQIELKTADILRRRKNQENEAN